MNSASPEQAPVDGVPDIPGELMAEAAYWVARLHGPSRNRKMELACLAWQATSPAHSAAFELCTDSWEMVGGITVRDVYAAASVRREAETERLRRSRSRWLVGLISGFLLFGSVFGVLQWRDRGVYATETGEQRSIALEDGTRVSLNTSTRVRVEFQAGRRRVDVVAGEALFEVAKDPTRPFVVHAAGSDVVALGTSFVVRVNEGDRRDALAVTLLAGRVSVQPTKDSPVQFGAVGLTAGDRVRIARGSQKPEEGRGRASVDRPSIDQATAWKRGEIVFDGSTLAEAVGEINRYSRSSIVLLGGPAVEERKVSGTFKTADIAGFAHAAAELHGLTLKQRNGDWELSPSR